MTGHWETVSPPTWRGDRCGGSSLHEFWDYTQHRSGDVFWVVGRERGRLTMDGASLELAIRTTCLFRRTGGRWRQIHHHGSIEDPDMLARYLAAVRGS
jgi:ketosteroid isomerase-like protein